LLLKASKILLSLGASVNLTLSRIGHGIRTRSTEGSTDEMHKYILVDRRRKDSL
jgi:hypothetical protein